MYSYQGPTLDTYGHAGDVPWASMGLLGQKETCHWESTPYSFMISGEVSFIYPVIDTDGQNPLINLMKIQTNIVLVESTEVFYALSQTSHVNQNVVFLCSWT